MKHAGALFAITISAVVFPGDAQAASLTDLEFLKGSWTSDRGGFVIEESWTDAQAGVVLGMSRGAQNGAVRFLRFAVVEQAGDTIVMRFKRYNADYTSWETDEPTIMRLIESKHNQVVFAAVDPASDVIRIVYRARDDGAVDVIANRADESGPYLVEFTLRRSE